MNEFKADVVQALKGHTSQETAYLVEDYPCGYRLRCKIRYWLEYKPKHGFRFVSQTTNPKARKYNFDGTVLPDTWNKPKASTYVENAVFMYLDSDGHVQWHGLGIYNDAAESRAFFDAYGEHINPEWLPVLAHWITLKETYEKKRAELIAAEGEKKDFSHDRRAAIETVMEVNAK